MDSIVSWFILCAFGLTVCIKVLALYFKANPIKEDPFADYNADKCAWWEK